MVKAVWIFTCAAGGMFAAMKAVGVPIDISWWTIFALVLWRPAGIFLLWLALILGVIFNLNDSGRD